MSSLLTNSSAMTALQTLRTVSTNMATTQNRISTGYRVATASDNSAYWSIATTMRSDNEALSAVSDALGLGAATVDTMYTALTSVVGDNKSGLTALKAKLVAAREPGVDRGKIQAEVKAIQDDLKNTSDLAVFNGENWLSVDSSVAGYNATKSVVSSFSRVAGAVTIKTIDVDTSKLKLYDNAGGTPAGIMDKTRTGAGGTTGTVATIDISTLTDSTADQKKLDDYIGMVDAALGDVTQASANLGAVKTRIDSNSNFVKSLRDAISRGVGQLVDADMNAESTRLQALQVQQQLGIQALSIANSGTQSILSLFRG
ncbi:flagellin N-terminal helical domain-containing protein [Bradyrhizobium sp. 2TAF24]|uniref:flagellin N-terminal helical domain-containing protein n=1 Tax=Bradyrhizobium sp. 2TAF24 TaxID=3233011 RepID=UPI003F918CAE